MDNCFYNEGAVDELSELSHDKPFKTNQDLNRMETPVFPPMPSHSMQHQPILDPFKQVAEVPLQNVDMF